MARELAAADGEAIAPARAARSVVIAAGQVREHADPLIAWAHEARVPLLLLPSDREALLQARRLPVSLVMLFQPELPGPVVRAFRRVAPGVPLVHVSPSPEHHGGVIGVSSQDPQALIRSASQLLPAERANARPLSLGALRVDPERGSAWIGGERVRIPRAQFRLLSMLLRDRGRTFDRETLCAEVLGTHGSPRRIDWHVARLRAALGPMARSIQTWPTGYSISD